MDGLEAVEMKLKQLEDGLRIDSELYKKSFRLFEEKILKIGYTNFEKESDLIKKGIFDIKSSCYVEKGIPFVRIGNLKNMHIDMENIIHIPESENSKNLSTFLQRGDIILSKTANAAASFVNIKFCNTSQDTIAIKLKKNSKVLSEYVTVFLNTVYGIEQMQKRFTGNIQMHLNLEDCKQNLLIPIFSLNFQKEIKNILQKAIEFEMKSKKIYIETENIMLEELKLKDWKPLEKNIAEKRIKESFFESGRLDAEYYQPKYDELQAMLYSNAKYTKEIKEIQTESFRGVQPVYMEKGKIDVVNSKHILENHIDYDNLEKTDDIYFSKNQKAEIRNKDILIYTTGANIGRTNIYLRTKKALASNHVNILRLKENINPYYISIVLNSLIGRTQTEKHCAGSAQKEIYPKDIEKFTIPFIDENKQKQIEIKLIKSYEYLVQAKRLFELSKVALEKAIEQDENIANKYIVDEIKTIIKGE